MCVEGLHSHLGKIVRVALETFSFKFYKLYEQFCKDCTVIVAESF